MSAGASRLPDGRTWAKTYPPSAKFIRLSQLRGLRGSEQVAAVCYRVRGSAIEFLLVQTRGGRWIFPKGGAEPGLTRAQAAALEAFEEAGVHGRIEEASFARYVRRKRRTSNDSDVELTVSVYLCEVLWLDAPQEAGRYPTWFSAQKAKRRLRNERASAYGAELARVIDSAIARIQRVHRGTSTFIDSLQEVQFIDGGRILTAKARRQKLS
jgi:8-oxo-dGTP pyrophosphatase MutT (NUDIX family)